MRVRKLCSRLGMWGEEGGEKGTNLVMNIMIICVVSKEELEWIKREAVATVVVYRFHCRERKQETCLTDGHS